MGEKRKTTPSMQMHDGYEVKFLEMGDDSIRLVDIALGLSRENRYVGQTAGETPYNVAHHSVLASYYVHQDYAKAALFHDCAEYITGDIPSPVKALLKPRITEIENRITQSVFRKFGIEGSSPDDPISEQIHDVDSTLYVCEVYDLCHPRTRSWHDIGPRPLYSLFPKIRPLGEKASFELFLDRFATLFAEQPWLMTA